MRTRRLPLVVMLGLLGLAAGCHSPGSPAGASSNAPTGGRGPGFAESLLLDSAGGRDPYTTARGDGKFQP